MATYNGHKNWNHWNVSLWINNDESIYRIAANIKRCYPKALDSAVLHFIGRMKDEGITHTPDGAPYSKSSVRAALANI